jgi:hypothetical protein
MSLQSKKQILEWVSAEEFAIRIMDMDSRFYESRLHIHGLSHGLKTCHRHVFAPVFGLGPPFRDPLQSKKADTQMGICRFVCFLSIFSS